MENITIGEIDVWKKPWDNEKTDNLYERDERFFAILVKGVLAFLNRNIILNGKSIPHFIFNTGSSYMYVEQNDYEFSMCETTGEDQMYMKMPRCICNIGDISFPQDELTNPYVRGVYERTSSISNKIESFSAELRRLPIEMTISLQYVLSTTNEALILTQEYIDKIIFQRYFNIVYLGQLVKCSIEFPQNLKIEFNKIDMASPDIKQKTISIDLKINTNYPIIDMNTEHNATKTISGFEYNTEIDVRDFDSDKSKVIYE